MKKKFKNLMRALQEGIDIGPFSSVSSDFIPPRHENPVQPLVDQPDGPIEIQLQNIREVLFEAVARSGIGKIEFSNNTDRRAWETLFLCWQSAIDGVNLNENLQSALRHLQMLLNGLPEPYSIYLTKLQELILKRLAH